MEYGYDATSLKESDWAKPGYCLTNYACFLQTLTTIVAEVCLRKELFNLTKYVQYDDDGVSIEYRDNPERLKNDFPTLERKKLVRMGCLSETNYGSWGIVDECMTFDLVSSCTDSCFFISIIND